MNATFEVGREGPRNDPYEWRNYRVTKTDGTVIELKQSYLRGNSVLVNGEVRLHEQVDLFCDEPANQTSALFQSLVGLTMTQLERAMNRVASMCPKCSSRKLEYAEGHPGESFEVCSNCGEVVNSFFHRSEII